MITRPPLHLLIQYIRPLNPPNQPLGNKPHIHAIAPIPPRLIRRPIAILPLLTPIIPERITHAQPPLLSGTHELPLKIRSILHMFLPHPKLRKRIHRRAGDVDIANHHNVPSFSLVATYLVGQEGMKLPFAIMSRPDHFPRLGVAVVVGGAVHGVDIHHHNPLGGKLGDEDAAFEVPGHALDIHGFEIFADEGADAVDSAAEAGGVVFVGRKAEVGFVQVSWRIVLVLGIKGVVDVAAHGGLGLGVRMGDLDFLEAHDVGP